jgi:NADPH:quinone reductase-like Zn-dependent oxidoreductase
MIPQKSQALRFKEFGKPLEVLSLEELEVPEPGPGEVLIKLIASPIIPADFGSILGNYGKLKELPATAGAMGIGEVVQVGDSENPIEVGQWVRIPEEIGVWQEFCFVKANELRVLPKGLDGQSACIAALNPPTAIRLLEDFASLKSGDWVIQNAGNSNVGIAIIQYAQTMGLKTVNLVRREELVQPLLDLGADTVVVEESFNPREIEAITKGGRPKLAINSVGGHSGLKILNALGPGGTHVTIGAMTFEPVRFPTRQLIFEDIKLCGFWLMNWQHQHSPEEVKALDDQVYSLIGDGTFKFPVAANYPLSEYKKALTHASEPRFGTVLFTAN